jgi:hypothetical protein
MPSWGRVVGANWQYTAQPPKNDRERMIGS